MLYVRILTISLEKQNTLISGNESQKSHFPQHARPNLIVACIKPRGVMIHFELFNLLSCHFCVHFRKSFFNEATHSLQRTASVMSTSLLDHSNYQNSEEQVSRMITPPTPITKVDKRARYSEISDITFFRNLLFICV